MKTLFVIVLVIFLDGQPVGGQMGGPFDTRADCEKKKVEAQAKADELETDVALQCVAVTHKPKPAKLKTERLS